MRPYILILSVVLAYFSVGSVSASCSITKKMVQQESNKHKSLFKTDVQKVGKEYRVSIYTPSHIEGLKVANAYFYKGTSHFDAVRDDFELFMPLEIMNTEQRPYVFLIINEKYTADNVVGFIYGDGCGKSIEYTILYDNYSLN